MDAQIHRSAEVNSLPIAKIKSTYYVCGIYSRNTFVTQNVEPTILRVVTYCLFSISCLFSSVYLSSTCDFIVSIREHMAMAPCSGSSLIIRQANFAMSGLLWVNVKLGQIQSCFSGAHSSNLNPTHLLIFIENENLKQYIR